MWTILFFCFTLIIFLQKYEQFAKIVKSSLKFIKMLEKCDNVKNFKNYIKMWKFFKNVNIWKDVKQAVKWNNVKMLSIFIDVIIVAVKAWSQTLNLIDGTCWKFFNKLKGLHLNKFQCRALHVHCIFNEKAIIKKKTL